MANREAPSHGIDGSTGENTTTAHVNPYLTNTDTTFVDAKLAETVAANAIKDIEQLAEKANNSIAVLEERARRSVNRARLIHDVALGEFVPSLKYAAYISEVIANRRWDLLDFDLRTIFPGADREQIYAYLARFRVPRGKHDCLPAFTFPMALGVWGDPRELDDFSVSTYRKMENIREHEKSLPARKKYLLSRWDTDFSSSMLSFDPLVTLPVLEDPTPYTLADVKGFKMAMVHLRVD